MLDYETSALNVGIISAADGGNPVNRVLVKVYVYVSDVNDVAPIFTSSSYMARIREGIAFASPLMQITATDPDSPSVTYALANPSTSKFVLSPLTGVLSTNGLFNLTVDPSFFALNVTASDSGLPVLTSWTPVNIFLISYFDESPVFNNSFFNVSVRENLPQNTLVTTLRAYSPVSLWWFLLFLFL